MTYAHPEVLVDTDWVANNTPNDSRKIVEVDYDPENGYKKMPFGFHRLTEVRRLV